MNNIVIKVEHLSKTFKTRGNKNLFTGIWKPEWYITDAVIDASFEVNKGEAVAFLGPNGAGKTTTTKMLSGIMYPSSGKVNVLGYTPQDRDPKYLSRIGLVMGNKSGLNWDLTARQSYQLLKEIYNISDNKYNHQLKSLSEMLNISTLLDRQVRRLSLGERMKVEIIAAILHEPEILFLDEPTIGLDIDSKIAVREFLTKLRHQKQVTIILTSHDMDDIEHVCKRVIVINKGALIFNDSLQKLNNMYSQWRYIRLSLDTTPNVKEIEKLGEIISKKTHSVILKVQKEELVKTTSAIASMPGLVDINIESVPLERIVSDLFNKNTT